LIVKSISFCVGEVLNDPVAVGHHVVYVRELQGADRLSEHRWAT